MQKFKWTSRQFNLIKFLASLFVVGIIIGMFIYHNEAAGSKTNILSGFSGLGNILKTTKQNHLLFHFILLSVLTVLSLMVIGLPFILFYFFYEGVSFGFLLASFFHYKKFEGLLFGVLFGIINKSLIYLALIYFLIISIRYSQKMLISIKNKDYRIYEYIANHLYKAIIVFVVVFLADIFIYFFGNKILAYFLFLL